MQPNDFNPYGELLKIGIDPHEAQEVILFVLDHKGEKIDIDETNGLYDPILTLKGRTKKLRVTCPWINSRRNSAEFRSIVWNLYYFNNMKGNTE